jgi:ribonuclease HI
LLAGLRIAIDLGIRKFIIRGDSQLVVRQINKDYQSPLMGAYVDEVWKLEEHFDGLQADHVPRARMKLLMTCRSVPPKSCLWNQGLLRST